jgi:hypothetical protein
LLARANFSFEDEIAALLIDSEDDEDSDEDDEDAQLLHVHADELSADAGVALQEALASMSIGCHGLTGGYATGRLPVMSRVNDVSVADKGGHLRSSTEPVQICCGVRGDGESSPTSQAGNDWQSEVPGCADSDDDDDDDDSYDEDSDMPALEDCDGLDADGVDWSEMGEAEDQDGEQQDGTPLPEGQQGEAGEDNKLDGREGVPWRPYWQYD